jgi:hypothetical protein
VCESTRRYQNGRRRRIGAVTELGHHYIEAMRCSNDRPYAPFGKVTGEVLGPLERFGAHRGGAEQRGARGGQGSQAPEHKQDVGPFRGGQVVHAGRPFWIPGSERQNTSLR